MTVPCEGYTQASYLPRSEPNGPMQSIRGLKKKREVTREKIDSYERYVKITSLASVVFGVAALLFAGLSSTFPSLMILGLVGVGAMASTLVMSAIFAGLYFKGQHDLSKLQL
ncbi:MAG: hypothetical protein ACSNEK_06120 [Parachlamydiaceae bacterium]